MSDADAIIASQSLFGQRAGEERFPITIEIGRPYKWEGTSPTEWACPVEVKPLYSIPKGLHGEGSFQALCLAVRMVRQVLVRFRNDGGTLSHEDGQEFTLKEFWGANESLEF